MARKQQPDKISHSRMQAIDDPTAAFPIGALSQLVDQDDDSGVYGRSSESEPDHGPQHEEQADEGDGSEESVEESEADAPPPSSPGAIQLGYLLLSLLGGGIAAALFAVVIVLAVLLL